MWTANLTVLDRIVVNIIDMMHQVNFAAGSVFPESLLDDGRYEKTLRTVLLVLHSIRTVYISIFII